LFAPVKIAPRQNSPSWWPIKCGAKTKPAATAPTDSRISGNQHDQRALMRLQRTMMTVVVMRMIVVMIADRS
jgi:hypothetical protein